MNTTIKVIFMSLIALAVGFTAHISTASAETKVVAATVEVPEGMSTLQELNEWALQYGLAQFTELAWVEAQTKYYELLRASFVGSRAMSDAFDAQMARDGARIGGAGVTIAMDIYLAKAWLSGATPTAMIIKDVWLAARGETGRMTAIGQKTLKTLTEIGKSFKVPKNVVSTVAIGVFAYVQVENFFVINMSEAQYNSVMTSLDLKIAALVARKQSIAARHVPYAVR